MINNGISDTWYNDFQGRPHKWYYQPPTFDSTPVDETPSSSEDPYFQELHKTNICKKKWEWYRDKLYYSRATSTQAYTNAVNMIDSINTNMIDLTDHVQKMRCSSPLNPNDPKFDIIHALYKRFGVEWFEPNIIQNAISLRRLEAESLSKRLSFEMSDELWTSTNNKTFLSLS